MFAGNFAPQGWAFCDGQLLSVTQNEALFSLLGTVYGGDGRTTFGLPDMRGRIPVHAGSGPGLSSRSLGAKTGTEEVTLTAAQLPSHNHTISGDNAAGGSSTPTGYFAKDATSNNIYIKALSGTVTSMRPNMLTNSGGSQSHNNMMPYQCVNFIISLYGIYPSRH